MITHAEEDRLVVISDLHLGNPFCHAKRQIVEFLSYAADNGYSICINGDGLDIQQTSFIKLAGQVPEVFRQLRRAQRNGCRVYYSLGNHDIILEHLLEDWGVFKIVPFLNVTSGRKRFHIEHGHLFDPFFMNYPNFYEFCTEFAGWLLKINPNLYKTWIRLEGWRSRFYGNYGGISGEPPSFLRAANAIMKRGFDAVIFGHTHHAGTVDLGGGKVYINTGSWLLKPTYVEIIDGQIALKTWDVS